MCLCACEEKYLLASIAWAGVINLLGEPVLFVLLFE
jgi:hypothetical protein